jgi:hypothetical protein
VESLAEFKINSQFKDNKYKLEICSILKDNIRTVVKGCQCQIVLMLKQSNIKILKSTDSSYIIEDKKITFNLGNFNQMEKLLIGMLFETEEPEAVEIVKVMYRYMVIFL